MTTHDLTDVSETAPPATCPMHGKEGGGNSQPPRISRRARRRRRDRARRRRMRDGRMSAAHANTATFTLREDRFGRIFRDLPPFATPSAQLTAALNELGKPGGIMDAKDPLEVGPVRLITEPALSPNNPDSTTHDGRHDVLRPVHRSRRHVRPGLALGEPTRPEDSTNTRSPALDLDSVYGGGPVRSPQLYGRRSTREPLAGIKLRVEHGGLFEDLPRNADGTAILGDPRNDEHVILAGLHAAFLMFHNEAVDYVAARNRRVEHGRDLPRGAAAHALALPMDDRARVPAADHRAAARQRHSAAAGASIARRSASCRSSSRARAIAWATAWCVRRIARTWPATTAGRSSRSSSILRRKARLDPTDLRGGVRAPRRFVGWQTFFDFGDGNDAAEQAARHDAVDAAVPAAVLGDRQRRRTAVARGAQSPATHHLVAAVRPVDRTRDARAGAVERRPCGCAARSVPTWVARRRCGSTSCGRRT